MADELGIVAVEHASVATVYGQKIRVDFAHGFVELGGKKMLAEILIFPGPPLIGVKLLSDFCYKAVVDCKNRTVHLERVV